MGTLFSTFPPTLPSIKIISPSALKRLPHSQLIIYMLSLGVKLNSIVNLSGISLNHDPPVRMIPFTLPNFNQLCVWLSTRVVLSISAIVRLCVSIWWAQILVEWGEDVADFVVRNKRPVCWKAAAYDTNTSFNNRPVDGWCSLDYF